MVITICEAISEVFNNAGKFLQDFLKQPPVKGE